MLIQVEEPGAHKAPYSKGGAVVGVDFGTTYSVVAHSLKGHASVLSIQGATLVPSVIQYHEGGEGYSAGRDVIQTGEQPYIRSFKRFLEPRNIRQELRDKDPIHLTAHFLLRLKSEAEKVLKEPIVGAVITVPAYYSEVARDATRLAARIAGFSIMRLLSEPTAAALAYGLGEEEGDILVYDLGGGTFDVSLLRARKGSLQVLAVCGDVALGGDDVDHSLMDFLGLSISHKHLVLARTIKEYLTSQMIWSTTLCEESLTVTRSDLEGVLEPFVNKTLALCQRVLDDSGVSKNSLRRVILAGGSTRIPYVQKRVRNFFGQDPLCSINPDEVVAMGAALHAETLRRREGKLLLDVTPQSLGIETLGGGVDVLIPKNSPLPSSASHVLTTFLDGQINIKIHVVQGNDPHVEKCISLATFVLGPLDPKPAGSVRIKVTFTLDADGVLSVAAQDMQGLSQNSVLVRPYGHDKGLFLA